jgi:serine/threonine-protein kinase
MTEPGAPASDKSPHSILSEKLTAALPPPSPDSLRTEERTKLAEQKVGLTLKGWRLGRLLGVGPVSAAYEATRGSQDGASRGVVRVLIGALGKNERAKSLFVRSAYAASRFQHPRVIAVTADGVDDEGTPFVVRPWSDGQPLAEVLAKDGPMSEAQALRLAEQVLDALEISHAHGVVHGAISPTNVLVTERGSMRLCDFSTPPGMTPRTEGDVLAPLRVTRWTPPERCSSSADPPTETCDVWSLGALMYFAVSRAAPRGDAQSMPDLARAPVRPLKDVAPGVSEGFAALVEHALAAEPVARYESAYAMLGDIRRVMAGRKPKLDDAQRPNPSGSYNGPPPRSSRRVMTSSRADISVQQHPGSVSNPRHDSFRPPRSEWRGNLALILAIAALVGVATFVMVRERVEEERMQRTLTPASSGQVAPKP